MRVGGRMKIIYLTEHIKLIYKNFHEYTIKSPLGVFKDINDAIEAYPIITENKHVIKCKYCGKYFLKLEKRDNRRVYCSEECKRYYKQDYNNQQYYQKKKKRDEFKLYSMKENKYNKEFNQDDTYWGIGNTNISGRIGEDFDNEHKKIRNEMKRLKIKSSN